MRPSQSDPLEALRRARDSAKGRLYIHYSCGVVAGNPESNPIGFIVVHPDGALSRTFDARASDETDMLKRFAWFVSENVNRIWIGWRFLHNDFGFGHIAARYAAIVGGEMEIPTGVLDLKDHLKQAFGSDFADHPRLESAARINHVTMIDLLDAEAAAAAFKAGNWPKLRANTARRVSMIRDLFYKAVNGEFVIKNSRPAEPANDSPTEKKPELSMERGKGPRDDQVAIRLLSVFTNRLTNERFDNAASVLQNVGLTIDEKLTEIDTLMPFPPTASASNLGELFGVSKQAVMKTEWWRKNRKGEKESEIGRRRDKHRDLAKRYEPTRSNDEDE